MGVSYPRLCAGGLWLPGHEEKELLKALICLLKAVLSLVQGVLSENIPFYPMPWECGGFQDWLSGVEGGGVPDIHNNFHFIMLLQRGHYIVGILDFTLVGVVLGEVWEEKHLEIVSIYPQGFTF